eukprot:CAMPEP_0197636532 /NCGR_PEP_ID=MMETSP1338-20131121/12007_1 /TAXON_ID=43686 ORGANISM="Pelagodinium beii, Strain RCC1491" /NCGR_SAMPLE_ID=MMETSP1338 /ASSEMBLY_ACC=CAM_ASM_000754 /LENGTH=165 /DNA_ID=CAMNT_0043208773 /DNA_START=74 /DNA_END=571 /DNA_ORIENTATION=+
MAVRHSTTSCLLALAAFAGVAQFAFVSGPAARQREVSVEVEGGTPQQGGYPDAIGAPTPKRAGYKYPLGNARGTLPYGQRDPLPEGYGIRTGLGDLLKPLNSEVGVTTKEDSIPTLVVMFTGIVALGLFYLLLLLINNQSILLPPEDEFDEYVANFFPYFFFGEK